MKLVDFSWSFRTTLASSKLAEMSRPTVLVQLDVEEHGVRRTVTMEMDKTELKDFVTKMTSLSDPS